MVKIAFRGLTESEFISLLKNINGGYSVKGGYRDIDIFRSNRKVHRGGGILSILGNIGRRALPFLTKYILPTARDIGRGVASDLIGGQNFKQSVKRRGKAGLKQLGERVLSGKGRIGHRKSLISSRRKMKVAKRGSGGKRKKTLKGTKRITKRQPKGGKRKKVKGIKKRKSTSKRRHNRKGCKSKFSDIFS